MSSMHEFPAAGPIIRRDQVLEILTTPETRQWNSHGIGMLRTYVDEGRRWRLNVWHSGLKNPGISSLHTHPWPFYSWIFAGRMVNIRYRRAQVGKGGGHRMMEGTINCGPKFTGLRSGRKLVNLMKENVGIYLPGEHYSQRPEEIHDTDFTDGTVTLIYRGDPAPDHEASVFWPAGDDWGDATRPFDWDEALVAIKAARDEMAQTDAFPGRTI